MLPSADDVGLDIKWLTGGRVTTPISANVRFWHLADI